MGDEVTVRPRPALCCRSAIRPLDATLWIESTLPVPDNESLGKKGRLFPAHLPGRGVARLEAVCEDEILSVEEQNTRSVVAVECCPTVITVEKGAHQRIVEHGA